MKTITIKTQKEFDDLPQSFKERVKIEIRSNEIITIDRQYSFNETIEIRGASHVIVRGESLVKARDQSFVVAWDQSYVLARDESKIVARDESRVEAFDESDVDACDNTVTVKRG